MKKPYLAPALILIAAALFVIGGFFIPLGSYIPTKSVCPDGEPPVERLHLIKGDSIQKVKAADVQPPPNVGCSKQVKYVLYVL